MFFYNFLMSFSNDRPLNNNKIQVSVYRQNKISKCDRISYVSLNSSVVIRIQNITYRFKHEFYVVNN